MPLEIKYKEPTDRPIELIKFKKEESATISGVHRGFNGLPTLTVGQNDNFSVITFTKEEFKQWAAAIYKFSQEI